MARRIELGAGLAAAALTVFTMAMLLTVPLVPVCPGGVSGAGCATAPRLIPLTAARQSVGAGVWLSIIVLALAGLAGGAGAVLDGLRRWRGATWLLWPAAVVALGGWLVTGVQGSALSLFFVPPVLALCIAASAALATRRGRAPRLRATTSTTAGPGRTGEGAGQPVRGGQS